MIEKYQDAILLINDLLKDKGHDDEIEELRRLILEFEKELKND